MPVMNTIRKLFMGPLAPLEAAADEARSALAKAERERSEATTHHAACKVEVASALDAYDNEATPDNERRAMKAKEAADLATLRKERAERRELSAREALAAAEDALEKARLDLEVEEARKLMNEAFDAEQKAFDQLMSSIGGLANIISSDADALEKAHATRSAAMKALHEAELAAAVSGDNADARLVFEKRANYSVARPTAGSCAALVTIGEMLADRGKVMLDAACAGQRDAAASARELGSSMLPFPAGYGDAVLAMRRYRALTGDEQARSHLPDQALAAFGIRNHYSKHVSSEEAAELALSNPGRAQKLIAELEEKRAPKPKASLPESIATIGGRAMKYTPRRHEIREVIPVPGEE